MTPANRTVPGAIVRTADKLYFEYAHWVVVAVKRLLDPVRHVCNCFLLRRSHVGVGSMEVGGRLRHKKEDREKVASASGNDKRVPDRVKMKTLVVVDEERCPKRATQPAD